MVCGVKRVGQGSFKIFMTEWIVGLREKILLIARFTG